MACKDAEACGKLTAQRHKLVNPAHEWFKCPSAMRTKDKAATKSAEGARMPGLRSYPASLAPCLAA